MKKLMKKKVNMFGKEFSVFAIIMVVMIGLASAALLDYYGSVTGLVTASQSVLVDGNNYLNPISNSYDITAGGNVSDCGHDLKNHAEIPAVVSLITTCSSPVDSGNNCGGVTSNVYGVLELTTKDGEWDYTDDRKATVEYSIVGDVFTYTITPGIGDLDISNYKLIYYKDNQNSESDAERMDTLGMVYVIDNGENIGSLPMADDWNVQELANYCDNGYDTYTHCKGAKLWLVPSANAKDGLVDWNGYQNFLYETDLMTYSDNGDGYITLPANGGGFNFCIDSEFAINLMPSLYTITTEVIPELTT